jgi:hypothetical protein
METKPPPREYLEEFLIWCNKLWESINFVCKLGDQILANFHKSVIIYLGYLNALIFGQLFLNQKGCVVILTKMGCAKHVHFGRFFYKLEHRGSLSEFSETSLGPGRAQGSMLWSQFSVIFDNFWRKNGIFLNNQCYDKIFA